MAERLLTDKMIIISETDEHGKITFANKDFVDMSGYAYEELMGKPHSILRHPDMPSVAFVDLWKTIRYNRIWNGFVCNRCKNGDFYWVYATVAPIKGPNGDRRYISFRRKPTDREKNYYAALYKTLKPAESL